MPEVFQASPQPTLGVEWELAFVDKQTRNTVPVAGAALDIIADRKPEHPIQREFLENTVELVTGVHHDVGGAMADLAGQVDLVYQAADELGVDVWTSGSHPFARGTSLEVSPKSAYGEIINRTQWWGRQMIIWGVHVHVGIPHQDRVWPIIQALLTNLPHLLAVSGSSPAFNGEDMGYASNRSLLYQQLPTAGLPPDIYQWQQWLDYMRDQSRSGVINHTKSMHLDIRPASKYGTIEVRVSDSPTNMQELESIVALTHALVVYYNNLLDQGKPLPSLQPWHNAENKWRAARYGMDALLIVNRDTDERWVKDEIPALLQQLEPTAEQLNCVEQMMNLTRIIDHGAAYQRQRKAAQAAGALPSLAPEAEVREREAELGHTPWVAAVDLAVRELQAGKPLAK